MTSLQKPSRTLRVTLWVTQGVLAVSLIWSGMIKLFQPVETLSAMWPWTGQVPVTMLKFTGLIDLLGAFGLILPELLRIKPKLTPIAAIGIVALMVCAGIFHIVRGEASVIGVNIVFAILASFVAWGRLRKVQ